MDGWMDEPTTGIKVPMVQKKIIICTTLLLSQDEFQWTEEQMLIIYETMVCSSIFDVDTEECDTNGSNIKMSIS